MYKRVTVKRFMLIYLVNAPPTRRESKISVLSNLQGLRTVNPNTGIIIIYIYDIGSRTNVHINVHRQQTKYPC